MRGWVALGVVLLLAGCGGGGGQAAKPVVDTHTATANTLVVSYSHWVISVPQDSGQNASQDFFTYAAHLWTSPSAALLTGVKLTPPAATLADTLVGPQTIDPADGTLTGPPNVIYWGSGTAIASGQPTVVQTGAWMPGYIHPTESLYLYDAAKDSGATEPVSGDYHLTADGGVDHTWHVDGANVMLDAALVTAPDVIVVDTLHAIDFTWSDLPGVKGYYAYAEGDVTDANGKVLRHVLWNIGATPLIFDAVYDLTPYLVPATQHGATIPAGVFYGCRSIQIHVAAMTPPAQFLTTSPALTVLNTSLSSRVYATFTQK